jgi:hypothetical protein
MKRARIMGIGRDETEVRGKKTECFCPKCRRVHKMKIRFIGRGQPRKFCPSCRDMAASVDPVHMVEYHKPRMFPGFVPGN